jgi:predicted CXXCH cytochrome family protein
MPFTAGFRRRLLIGLVLALTAVAAWAAADWRRTVPPEALKKATYVGRQSCVACHQEQAALFHGSDHDLAMDLATEETVLGDFNNVEFARWDQKTRFFRDGKKFMVNAEGPDGDYHDYEVKYVFGVRPLQQYMVEFPDGRVQVLRVSWDVEQKKWFYVAPPDAPDERIEPGDPFHWTGLTQNWNTMCAECHVTDYHKNYDLATNTYHSTFKEIDVSCETCHGPGSLHVELAESYSPFWDRKVGYGLTNVLKGGSAERQIETCAPCHSRRGIIHPDFRAGDSYFDHFELALLEPGLYHADGQIQDEDYEYGSFTQSKMFRKGVRCSDCHDPHSVKLKYEGNRLCAQCHQPGIYDGPAHHRHPDAPAGSPQTQCVTCHMPETVYMGIDARRDHSIRVPRPDLTAEIGTPNACNRCHAKPEENAQWAADAIVKWFGPKRPDDPHYARAIHAGRRGAPEGSDLLAEVMKNRESPAIVRATAIELLERYPDAQSEKLRRDALEDDSPLVRAAAARAVAAPTIEDLARELAPMLEDSKRNVRVAVANRLIVDAASLVGPRYDKVFKEVLQNYRQGQAIHYDRAQSHRNLANVSLQLGDTAGAVAAFRQAIKQEPYLTGPRTELAQILAQVAADRNQAALWEKLDSSEEEIQRLREEELELLARDIELLPNQAPQRFHRGMLLVQLDRLEEARSAFEAACELGPNDYESWMWLALVNERLRLWDDAAQALQQMANLRPEANEWKGILVRIRQTLAAEKAAGKEPQGEEKEKEEENEAKEQERPPAPKSSETAPPAETPPAEAPAVESPAPPATPGQTQPPGEE